MHRGYPMLAAQVTRKCFIYPCVTEVLVPPQVHARFISQSCFLGACGIAQEAVVDRWRLFTWGKTVKVSVLWFPPFHS